jgi:hypothetical protein
MTPKNKLDYWYFTTGAAKGRVPRLTEAVPFAKEFRSILQQQNLIKNRYQKITPNLLYNIKNTLKSGESTRIYDFMKKSGDSGYTNIESLSKAMNKLPAFAPFIGFGGALGSGNK